jgi:hypothetical protein
MILTNSFRHSLEEKVKLLQSPEFLQREVNKELQEKHRELDAAITNLEQRILERQQKKEQVAELQAKIQKVESEIVELQQANAELVGTIEKTQAETKEIKNLVANANEWKGAQLELKKLKTQKHILKNKIATIS